MSAAAATRAIVPLPLDYGDEGEGKPEVKGNDGAPVAVDEAVAGTRRTNGSGGGTLSLSTDESTDEAVDESSIDYRLSRGRYTIIALAATPPLSISHVSRVLRGISRPSLDVAQRIADAAGVELTDLQAFLRDRQESPLVALKGKRPRGPSAKFNHDTAREIRARFEHDGDTVDELAAEYGASRQAINEIVRGVSYPPS